MTSPDRRADSRATRTRAACPACGADEATALTELRDHLSLERFTVATCSSCGAQYLLDPPRPEHLGQYYDTAAGAAMQTKPSALFVAMRDRRIAADLRPLLAEHAPSAVLDLGTGDGSVAGHLVARGIPAIGLDVYPEDRWTHPEIPYHQLDFAAIDTVLADVRERQDQHGAAQPDTAILRHVLEHVPSPADLLSSLRGHGVDHVLIIVPNHESRLARRFGASWYYWDPPRHLTFFTRDSLRRTAERAGFEMAYASTYGLDELATSAHRSLLLRGNGRGRRLAHTLRPTGLVAGAGSVLSGRISDTVLHAVLRARA